MKKLACMISLALVSGLALAQPVPDDGLRAEMAGQWTDAIGVYEAALRNNPAQAHLWERIADIRATQLKNPAGAADALREAVRIARNDARLQHKLSQALAATQDGPGALAAINRAVELEPANATYLRARGVIATWTGDYALALASYERVLAGTPGDADAILGSARAAARSGQRDAAVPRYRAYLEQRPQDKDVMLEYMELEAERGNTQMVQATDVLYRQRFGESREYWLRMADVYALSNDAAAASKALQEAARLAPDDAALHYRIAQSYQNVADAPAALTAIERAIALEPKNLEYLRTRADLAAWQGDYATAIDSHQRILEIAPNDAGARLGIARVRYWQSELEASKAAYEDYLARHPDVAAPWLEYVVVLTERGDYARAIEVLDDTGKRFGDSLPLRKQRARVLAWADRPTASLGLVDALAPELPDDYELGYTRTVALHYAHQTRDALASLDATTKLRPDSKESIDLARFIRTPLRSNATAGFGYLSGTDDVSIRHAYLRGEYVINPDTRLFGGTDRQRLHAKVGSGYEKPDGGTSIDYTRVWLGMQHRVSPVLSLDAQAGGGRAEGDNTFVYEVGADYEPIDTIALRLAHRQDLFAVSPRAAKLGIERRSTTLDATWTPDLRWTLDGRLGYDTLSDGNDRREAALAPRRAVLRSQRLNLDLGVSGRWFGYDIDPGNGYYAPSSYRRYAVTAFTYWKLSDDDGVSVAFSYGPYKDNTMSGYRSGGDVVLEGFFGLYRDWYLNVKAGLSDYSGGAGAGAGYRSNQFEVSLTRRF